MALVISGAGASLPEVIMLKGINRDGSAFDMANALHFYYDAQGKIARMLNWYGQAV
jgi:hypothetical protein